MTSAWLVRPDEGDDPESHALSWPDSPLAVPGWEAFEGRAIGLSDKGRLVVPRFFGYPTGCTGSPCTIPSPAYAVSVFDLESRDAFVRAAEVDFLVDFDAPATRLSADGSWLHVLRYGGAARTLNIGTGEWATAQRLGTAAGASADGELLFGLRVDEPHGAMLLVSGDVHGVRREVASIAWPTEAVTTDPIIRIEGLIAAGSGE
jgi:hypothetical protein